MIYLLIYLFIHMNINKLFVCSIFPPLLYIIAEPVVYPIHVLLKNLTRIHVQRQIAWVWN